MARLSRVPVLLLSLSVACGGGEDRSRYMGRSFDGPIDLDGGLGPGGVDLAVIPDLVMNSQGASIRIEEPAANALVNTATVKVVAEVNSPGAGVTAVQVRLAGQMKATAMSLRAGTTNKYEAELDLASQMSGLLSIYVDATNTRMVTNTAAVSVIYDAGPTLSFREPSAASYKGSAPLVFDARGESTIQGGQIKAISATVQDVTITLTTDKANDFLWTGTGTIAFGAAVFPIPLTGTQVVRIQAENQNGTRTTLERSFTIDETGPEIEFVNPKAGEIIGSVVTMVVKVTDASGVNDNSVVAVWLNDANKYQVAMARIPGTDNFTARFDTRRLPEPLNLIYPSLSYRARDRLGNQSSRGEVLILDNSSPIMSLEPPMTQARTKDDMALPTKFKCSDPFNPVGTHNALAKDGRVLNQIVTVRARILDRGNSAPGLAIEHFATLDPSTVDLLVTPLDVGGLSPPLVVDADGKGTCNNLNPLLQPTSLMTASNQALVLRMVEITTAGNPFYGREPLGTFTVMPDPKTGLLDSTIAPNTDFIGKCNAPAMPDTTFPEPLCDVLRTNEPGFIFAIPKQIWTIGPVTQHLCAGLQLDSLNVLPEGAYCLAVRAADKAGNRNISKPVRICINRSGMGACTAFTAAFNAGTLPSCRGKYDPAMQRIVAGQCTLEPAIPFPFTRRVDGDPYLL